MQLFRSKNISLHFAQVSRATRPKLSEHVTVNALSRAEAEMLLNMKHRLVRVDIILGVDGGIRPVKYLVKKWWWPIRF